MLDLYEIITVDGKQYVRKERLDELERYFDAVCQGHTVFVNAIYDRVIRKVNPETEEKP